MNISASKLEITIIMIGTQIQVSHSFPSFFVISETLKYLFHFITAELMVA